MIRLLAALLLCVVPMLARADPVSGYDFLSPETRALQDDDFANPGMLWVGIGQRLWDAPAGKGSCRSCHGAAENLRGVGAVYPLWDTELERVISLEQRINQCRERQNEAALPYSSRELLGLSALVMHQSRGIPQSVRTDGPAAEAIERGRLYFDTRRGQLNLSCSNCHDDLTGHRLRGEVISQGQVNGFPIYRQLWQDMGSVGRMIAWCNDAVRAEPLAEGSQMAVALEMYLRARGNGLPIESPAVRR